MGWSGFQGLSGACLAVDCLDCGAWRALTSIWLTACCESPVGARTGRKRDDDRLTGYPQTADAASETSKVGSMESLSPCRSLSACQRGLKRSGIHPSHPPRGDELDWMSRKRRCPLARCPALPALPLPALPNNIKHSIRLVAAAFVPSSAPLWAATCLAAEMR